MNPRFVPLTRENYAEIVGSPPTKSCRGFAIESDGRTLVVVGVAPDGHRHILFAEFSPAFRAEIGSFGGRRVVAMGARKTAEMLFPIRGPIDADADPEAEGSDVLLRKLGFRKITGSVFRRDPPTMRQLVEQAEAIMKARGTPVDIKVRHYFSDGVYAREITVPYVEGGVLLTGKIHKRANLNILSKGEISVLTEKGMERLSAPATIVSPPGTKRIAWTHSEVVWTTIHGTRETDLVKIEAEFIAQDEIEYLAYTRALGE